jgi:hypothetical protein
MNAIEKITTAGLASSLLGATFVFLFDALILWWVCGVLLPIFPVIACVAGLTYFDWVGICFGFSLACRWLAKLFKAVWAK